MLGYSARHAASETPPPFTQEQSPYGEFTPNTEAFMPVEGARQLVEMVMRGRVDPTNGALLPLQEDRALMNVPGAMMKPLPPTLRYDIVLPEKPTLQPVEGGGEMKIRGNYSILDALYQGLTQERPINLSAADVERVKYEKAKLEQILSGRSDMTWRFDEEQAQNAYHISQKNAPAAGSDGLTKPQSEHVHSPTIKQKVPVLILHATPERRGKILLLLCERQG